MDAHAAQQAAPTIGIPRALLYYYYEDLWLDFFANLGIEAVVSPPTNKAIIKAGVNSSIDEECYSAKLFLGHVECLIGKCDMIFVPRVENTGIREEYCTKFFGLYDLTKNTFPEAKLLCTEVDFLRRKKEVDAFIELGVTLGGTEEESLIAYKSAKATADEIKVAKVHAQEELLARDSAKVLLVSHAYNTFDASIGQDILNYFADTDFDVIHADTIDSKEAKTLARKAYSSRLYWRMTADLLGGVEMYKDRVDGIILISAFPCGPDSIFNELVIRTVNDKPMLSLVIDEQDASAGIQTRLESFVDIITAQRGVC